jgi:hypothetical protein
MKITAPPRHKASETIASLTAPYSHSRFYDPAAAVQSLPIPTARHKLRRKRDPPKNPKTLENRLLAAFSRVVT